IGTARAMEWGELEGAMSSLAIVVSGLLTVLGASVFANFL
ncbi:MAG: LrgB family protein, partial [Oscillospiraceae bacterium]|nr:LrgB family protein [Oscillospiraceae bacterium]